MALKAIDEKVFGVLSDGREARLWTLRAGRLRLTLTNYGATLVSLFVPDKNGVCDDILLGYSTLGPYTRKGFFFGATIGRFANRVGKARFTLNGKTYSLADNDSGNSLHGGRRGFDRALWEGQPYESKDGVFVRFAYASGDGEEGYPGACDAEVTYGITADGRLLADYKASLSAPSPVNLTNHSYFNLAGEGAGSIMAHEVKLYAPRYVEVGSGLIPTGALLAAKGTPFDFTAPKKLEKDAQAAGGGYDHCFAVDNWKEDGSLRPVAEVSEETSGRKMTLRATQPGVQLYTGNFLTGAEGKSGSVYGKQSGFCLETQHFPDSPNQASFPSAIFGPQKPYHERAEFAFGIV